MKAEVMPTVEISDTAFNYLKSLAEPFTDTPATVLDRIIAEHGARAVGRPAGAVRQPESPAPAERYSASTIPEMRFTKIEEVEIEGFVAEILKWNELVEAVVLTCIEKGHDSETVRRKLDANTVKGREVEAGFRYIDAAKFSFQGLDAQRACEAAVNLAKAFGLSLKVRFRWRENPKAARPGATAIIAAA